MKEDKHNCPIPEGNIRGVNRDRIITAICKKTINIDLSEVDISRSHLRKTQ